MGELSDVDYGIIGACLSLTVVFLILWLRWQCLVGWCCDPRTRQRWEHTRRLDKILRKTKSAALPDTSLNYRYAVLSTELFEPAQPGAIEALQSAVNDATYRQFSEEVSWAEKACPPLRNTDQAETKVDWLPPSRRIHPEHVKRISRYAVDTDDGRFFVVVKRKQHAKPLKQEGFLSTTGDVYVRRGNGEAITRLLSLLKEKSAHTRRSTVSSRQSITGKDMCEDLEVISLHGQSKETRKKIWKVLLDVDESQPKEPPADEEKNKQQVLEHFPSILADVERCREPEYRVDPKKGRLVDLLCHFLSRNPQYHYWQNVMTVAVFILEICGDNVEESCQLLHAIARYQLKGQLFPEGLHHVAETRSMQAVNQALAFWDPHLAIYLADLGLETSLYANNWISLMWADVLPKPQCYMLWDLIFSTDDRLSAFVAVALLMHYRQALFQCNFNEALVVVSKLRVDGVESNWSTIIRHALWLWANSPPSLAQTEMGPLDEYSMSQRNIPCSFIPLSKVALDYSMFVQMVRDNARLRHIPTENQGNAFLSPQRGTRYAPVPGRSLPSAHQNMIRSWTHRNYPIGKQHRFNAAAASVPVNHGWGSDDSSDSSLSPSSIELPIHVGNPPESPNRSFEKKGKSKDKRKQKKLRNYVKALSKIVELSPTTNVSLVVTLPTLLYVLSDFGDQLFWKMQQKFAFHDLVSLVCRMDAGPEVNMNYATLKHSSRLFLDMLNTSQSLPENVVSGSLTKQQYRLSTSGGLLSMLSQGTSAACPCFGNPLSSTQALLLADALAVYDMRLSALMPTVGWEWIVNTFVDNFDYITIIKVACEQKNVKPDSHICWRILAIPEDTRQKAEEQINLNLPKSTDIGLGLTPKNVVNQNYEKASCNIGHISQFESELADPDDNHTCSSLPTTAASRLDVLTNVFCYSNFIGKEYNQMFKISQEQELSRQANQCIQEVHSEEEEQESIDIIQEDKKDPLLEDQSEVTVEDLSVEPSHNVCYFSPWSKEELWLRETHPSLWERKNTMCLLVADDFSLLKGGRDLLVRAGFGSVAALELGGVVKISCAENHSP